MDSGARLALLVLVGGFVVFSITRRFWWWYFGVDRVISLLASIDESLKCLPAVAERRARAKAARAETRRDLWPRHWRRLMRGNIGA